MMTLSKCSVPVVGDDVYAAAVACDAMHGRVEPFVCNIGDDFFDIMFRTACHRPPLRSVVDLEQAVVVAKPHHGRDGELQHLLGRAAPDAAQHGQQIPVPKFVAETLFDCKKSSSGCISDASLTRFRQYCVAKLVEAQQIANMRQNLGFSRLLRCANTVLRLEPLHSKVPFFCGTWTENDMSDLAVATSRSAKSLIKLRVSSLVEHQKPRVYAVRELEAPFAVGRVTSTVCVCPPK